MSHIELADFYSSFKAECKVAFEADGNSTNYQNVLNKIGEYLEEDGDFPDGIIWTVYEQADMGFCGYSFDEERNLLTVFRTFFAEKDEIETITKAIYENQFNKLKRFVLATINSKEPLHSIMSPSDESCESIRTIYELFQNKKISKIRMILISDGIMSQRTKYLESTLLENIKTEFLIFDLNYIYNLATKEDSYKEIDIIFSNYGILGLPFIKASLLTADYNSYLAVLPATILARIYDEFGQRLLEQNVRTFLQFKANTNKGMMITIKEHPERFFAYNNGLTCTASSIETDYDENNIPIIKSVKGLQIVNGGQTSSVIFRAFKNKQLDLSSIFVQVKLSVVEQEEQYEDFVAKVARYANSQNPVKESDFFSNSPFHKDFKSLSEKITARTPGLQYDTHWFYERVRGQYANERAKFSKGSSKEKQFSLAYPKEQVVDKILLAKTEMMFLLKPHFSANSKMAFSEFTKYIIEILDHDQLGINSVWFKEAISKVIISQQFEKIIRNYEWIKQRHSVRAYIKAYTISLLVNYLLQEKRYINFSKVWDEQNIPEALLVALEICLKQVKIYIENLNNEADLRENFRKEKTWNEIKQNLPLFSDKLIDEISSDNETDNRIKKEAKKIKLLDNGIEQQTFVLNIKQEIWIHLQEFYKENINLCGIKSFEILNSKVSGRISLPSEKQAAVLFKLYHIAKDNGVNL